MILVPTPTPCTTPVLLLTVATDGLADDHEDTVPVPESVLEAPRNPVIVPLMIG